MIAQQGLKVFDTGNYEDNFDQAMGYMNGLVGHSMGFVMESGKIAVLPQSGDIYKRKRKTGEFHDGKYNVLREDVVPNKQNRKGYSLSIDDKWEVASKMIIGGYAEGVHSSPWDASAQKIYNSTDIKYQNKASTLGVFSLIYFLNPQGFDHSSIPYRQTVKYIEIPIIPNNK